MKYINIKKYINKIVFCLTLLSVSGFVWMTHSECLNAQEPDPQMDVAADPLVIVLDPGHGGDEEGGLYEYFIEKDLNLIVANAMKAELEKYEGVTVYLTRTGDQKLSLAERSAFAKSVNADFMFCLHFNLSGEHTLFGAECWVSAFGEEHSKGYSFADIEIRMLEEMGLYSRGIKTRLNKDGLDYYGIIRTASELEVPCVLIEHCHMDHENDRSYCEGREQWEAFGRLDATAAAKYFHLKSDILGVDYRDYQNLEVPVPAHVVKPDSTPPDVCMIELVSQDMDTGAVTIQLSATDYDSGMLYYAYSYDGGETFSDLQRWEDKSHDTITFTMQVPPHILPQIVVNAYNGYDLYTESNLLSLSSMDYMTEEEMELAAQLAEEEEAKAMLLVDNDVQEFTFSPDNITVSQTDNSVNHPNDAGTSSYKNLKKRDVSVEESTQPLSVKYFLSVCLVCALLVLGMAFSVILLMRSRKKRRRRWR